MNGPQNAWRRRRRGLLLALKLDCGESTGVPIHKFQSANTIRAHIDRLNGAVARLRNRHGGKNCSGPIVRNRSIRRAVVLVYEHKRAHAHLVIKFKYRLSPIVVLVRAVNQPIPVRIVEVVGENGDVADPDSKVRIKLGVRTVGVEDDQRVGEVVVR